MSNLFRTPVMVLIMIFIVFVSLEVFTRLFIDHYKYESLVPKNVGQFDANLGWSLKPNARGFSRRTGQLVEYKINSKGLRDDETTYEKPPQTFRVVLVGDSNTFGSGTLVNQHFSQILEGYFKNLEVINLGVSGYGIDQYLLFLQQEGFLYHPDLVIAYLPHYKNHRHMHKRRWGKEKPLFIVENNQLILTNSPIQHSGVQRYQILRDIDEWGSRHVKFYLTFRNSLQRFIKSIGRPPLSQDDGDKQDLNREDFIKMLHDLGMRIIYKMHEETLNNGAKFVLVAKVAALHETERQRQAFYESMSKHQIPLLNVSEALKNDRFPLPDGLSHLKESGHGVLAWEITQFLKRQQLIPAEYLTTP